MCVSMSRLVMEDDKVFVYHNLENSRMLHDSELPSIEVEPPVCWIFYIFMLHQMHEMQSDLSDVCSICLSVCLSVTRIISASLCKSRWTDQNAVWDEHSWGPMKLGVRCGSLSPTERRRGPSLKFWDPFLSPEQLKLDLKFCVHIEGWGP